MHYSSFTTARWLDLIATVGLGCRGRASGTGRGDRSAARLSGRQWALGLLLASLPLQAADYWIAPPGSTNTGTKLTCVETNPMPYVTADVLDIVVANPKSPTDTTVNVYFKPGTYNIDQLFVSGANLASRVLRLAPNAGSTNEVVLRWRVPTTNQGYGPTNLFTGPPSWDPVFFHFDSPIDRFEATNLVIDVNWPTWAATNTVASPAFPEPFKMSALWVKSNTGLLRHLAVKNCGASGRVPAPYWNGAGAEAFPVYIQPTKFLQNQGTTNTAWVIEDCAITDFHVSHGGYGTMVMMQCIDKDRFDDAAANPSHRVACVRRCTVTGNGLGIGFGSANSVGVAFCDNVVQDLSSGFNFDTATQAAPLRYFDITHNVFLDVNAMGNIGASLTCGQFSHFKVSDNLVRLRGVPVEQRYTDFRWTNQVFGTWSNLMPVTDVSLPVGRFEDGLCYGLRLAGATSITFTNNVFTTAPIASFYEGGPGTTDKSVFTPLHRPATEEWSGRWVCQSGTVIAVGNRLAEAPLEFEPASTLPYASLTNRLQALAPPAGDDLGQTQTERPPRPKQEPGGEKMEPAYTDGDALARVTEVQVGVPTFDGSAVEVRARLVEHHTASWPYGVGSTRLWPEALRLRVMSGAATNEYEPVEITADQSTAVFQFAAGGHAEYEMLVVQEGGAHTPTTTTTGSTVRFARGPDVANDRRLLAGQVRLVRTGTTNTPLVVKLRSAPSNRVTRAAGAGDDFDLCYLNLTAVPYTNGTWTCTMSNLTETLLAKSRLGTANQDVAEYEAAYFEIVGDSNYAAVTSGWGVTGLSYAESTHTYWVAAVTFWDGPKYRGYELTDYHYYQCGGQGSGLVLAEGGVEGAAGDSVLLAAGAGGGDLVPEAEEPPLVRLTRLPLEEAAWGLPGAQDAWTWPVEEAALSYFSTPGKLATLAGDGCYLQAVSSAVYELNQAVLPRLAGVASFYNFGQDPNAPSYFTLGGRWWWPTTYDLVEIGTPWSSPLIYAVDDLGNLAGRSGTQACRVPAGTSIPIALQSLASGRPGEAASIRPAGDVIVGWSTQTNTAGSYIRPTRWNATDSWAPEDLGSFGGSLTNVGYASMINSNLVTVGKTWVLTTNNVPAWRAFRTIPGYEGNKLSADWAQALGLPTSQVSTNLNHNWANGVNRMGDAVGATQYLHPVGWDTNNVPTTNRLDTRVAVWWAGNPTPYGMGKSLEPVDGDATKHSGRSEALAVNQQGSGITVVGTAWATPYGYARAFVMEVPQRQEEEEFKGLHMLNLNDPHLSWLSGGWLLTTAEAVNDGGIIVGNGTWNGYGRGWVLVPQSLVSQ